MEKKWWGWGLKDKIYNLDSKPDFLPFLKKSLESDLNNDYQPVPFDEINLPEIKINKKIITQIEKIIGKENVCTDKYERLTHAYGKSYKDLVRIRKGLIPVCHDLIIYPKTEQEIVKILAIAEKNNLKIIPFGGGTSVVGGVEHQSESPSICLDLTKNLNRLLNLDKKSHLATFQAGIFGPDLEKSLNERGYTLSHYPQSFEFSTLGGWVAARSAGQQSTKYGKIEKLVSSLNLVSPKGEMQTRKLPAKATGPDLNQIIIGSEGIYGIITEVTVKIHPLPEVRDYRGYLFESFNDGIKFIKELIHEKELFPATVRLSDEVETRLLFKLSDKKHSFIKDKVNNLVKTYMKEVKHFSFDNICFLLLGFEGLKEKVNFDNNQVHDLLRRHKVVSLGKSIGERWYETRFDLPYLRDALLDKGVLVDTLETSTIWSNVDNLYNSVKTSLEKGITETDAKGFSACHISHIYPEGASLYYTFVANQKIGNELEQWLIIKRKATDAIVENYGAISHHHGIGSDHTPWLKYEIGETGINILKGIKEKLDPANVMNPQNLLES